MADFRFQRVTPWPTAMPATIPDPPSSIGSGSNNNTNSSTGTKRKREAPQKFYSVRRGRQPGIYYSWPDCLAQVEKFPKALFKGFKTLSEAQNFLNPDGGHGESKWYGVRHGRVPGVYTDWQDVLDQVTGWKGARQKAFKSKAEAERFVVSTEGEEGGAAAAAVARGGTPGSTGTGTGGGAPGAGEQLVQLQLQPQGQLAGPPAKKLKTAKGKRGVKDEGSPSPALQATSGGEYEPGEAPLPEDVEDGFDTTIVVDPVTNGARYKSRAERERTAYQAVRPVAQAPVRIYTDGSSLGNGTVGAMAGVGVYFGPGDGRNVSEPLGGTKQTNQRAELTALVRALELAPRDRRVVIVTDSQYAIKCVTEWFANWRQNGWLNASRKPVENRDLVQKILDLLEERFRLNKHRMASENESPPSTEKRAYWNRGPGGVLFEWVKGHAKDESNNAADRLAVAGSRMAQDLMAAGLAFDD